jgi:hypothetical protein
MFSVLLHERNQRPDVKKNFMSGGSVCNQAGLLATFSLMRRDESAGWSGKVKPSLIGFAGIYKQIVCGSLEIAKLPPAQREQLLRSVDPTDRSVEEKLEILGENAWSEEELTRVDPFYVLTFSALTGRSFRIGEIDIAYSSIPNENPANAWLLMMMEFVSEQRFGRPLYQLVAEDRKGVKESSEKMQRIMQDGHKLRYGETIEATKGKIDHRIMFSFGLALGLDNLSCEELASFFDEFCPTCQKEHDPDSLCRQRDNLKQQQQTAIDWGRS